MSPTDGQARRTIAGRYVLRGLLGKGGMADVELAYDEVLDRQVAIKLLHDQFIRDENFVERFRREAQSAAALNHPNVVAVYDTGTDNGRPYIVMEYVAGRTLREILKTDAINPTRAAEIAAEAAGALGFAHERGIVHRDIKPGNIMIADDGRVKVCDFGIARAANAENVTQTAAVFGTAAYVAPEQAQGQKVDGRTDLYALGCVLFEMLTGRQPYIGDSPVALAYKHVSEAPPMPRSLNPEIPEGLEHVVLKAMEKDPDERYANGKDFAQDLRLAAEGAAVSATATTAFEATRVQPGASYERTQVVSNGLSNDDPNAYTEEDYEEAWYDDEDEDDGYARRSAPMSWTTIAIIAVFVLAIAGGGFAAVRFMSGVGQVEVPDLAGKSFQDAQNLLLEKQLQPALGESRSSDTVEPNHVITTDPTAGAKVDRAAKVTMILSSGPDTVSIPALSRLTRAQAEDLLNKHELKVGNVTREPDPKIARGLVISSQPAAGTSVKRGTEINLVISSGGETFTVPKLVGLTETAAREALAKVCGSPTCVKVTVEVDEDKTGDGRVIETDPKEGEEMQQGDEITLTVSKVKASTPVTTPTQSSSPSSSPKPSPSASASPSAKPSPSTQPSQKPAPSAAPSAKPSAKPSATKPAPKPSPTKPAPKPKPKPTGGGGNDGPIDVAPPTPVPGG